MKRVVLSFVGALISFLVIPWVASAMEVSPSLIELQVDPGQAQTRTLNVKNNESRPQTYYFQLQKFLPRGEQGQQEFLPAEDITGLPSWTYLSQANVTLQPNESRVIQVSVRAPEQAAPGGYYEAIFVSNTPTAGARSSVAFRTGALVFVTVRGEMQHKLQVSDLTLSSTDVIAHLPISVQGTIENIGGVHERPQGFFVVRNIFGRIVERTLLNQEGLYVLPGSRRQLRVIWEGFGKPPVGATFWQQVRKEWSDGLVGRYTGRFEIQAVEGGDMAASSEVKIVIWPWHLLLVMGVSLFLLLLGARAYRARIIREAKSAS